MAHITIQSANPSAPEVRQLIDQLDAYHYALYPADSLHLLPIEELHQAHVSFRTITVDGQLAGCGAMLNQGNDYAEIKRLFVLPAFRGMKLGQRLLAELETLARAAGLAKAMLETGVFQPEALGLYEKAGYQRRGPFGDYAFHPLCVFMEKRLA